MCMDRFLFQNRNIISCSTHQSFRYKPFSGFVGPVPSTSPAPALSPSPSPAPASTPSPHISYSSFTNTIPPLPHSSPSPSPYLQIHFLAVLSPPVTHFWICSHLWLCSHFQRLNDGFAFTLTDSILAFLSLPVPHSCQDVTPSLQFPPPHQHQEPTCSPSGVRSCTTPLRSVKPARLGPAHGGCRPAQEVRNRFGFYRTR